MSRPWAGAILIILCLMAAGCGRRSTMEEFAWTSAYLETDESLDAAPSVHTVALIKKRYMETLKSHSRQETTGVMTSIFGYGPSNNPYRYYLEHDNYLCSDENNATLCKKVHDFCAVEISMFTGPYCNYEKFPHRSTQWKVYLDPPSGEPTDVDVRVFDERSQHSHKIGEIGLPAPIHHTAHID